MPPAVLFWINHLRGRSPRAFGPQSALRSLFDKHILKEIAFVAEGSGKQPLSAGGEAGTLDQHVRRN